MLIPLETAKAHLRIDGPDEDAIVALYLDAAEDQAQQYLGRRVYQDAFTTSEAIIAGDTTALTLNASVEAAVLLIAGHLHSNRQDVVVGTISTALDMGSRSLLAPYRVGLGV